MANLIFINDEKFHQIENFSSYFISRNGNIYNDRMDRIMNQNIIKGTGYKAVNLKNDDGKYITKKVHKLLIQAFIPNLLNKKCVNHIDGNKLNNSLDNLEWCTHSENLQHAWNLGLRRR